MKSKYLKVLFCLLASALFLAFRFADDPFEALLKKLAAYNEEHPQEKVYLHLDKPYYAVGDNIWFKAYVTDNRSGQLSKISSAIYVELISEGDSIKKQIKLPLVSGLSWGDFKLTDTLKEGNYRIRAYTQWMRNAGPDYFFDKTIRIGNAWANKVFTSTTYTFGKKNNAELVDAVIRFSDKDGNPYAGQSVSYEVHLKNKPAGRGKGMTNAQGEVNFSFQNATGTPASGAVTATITLPNKQQIVKTIPVKTTASSLSVQLFPEGGALVENLPSKVGIKAISPAGLGIDVSGVLTDNDGTEVLAFNTTHLGMGNFIVNPQPGKTYTARIKLKDGTAMDIPLPKAVPSGYVLSVNNSDSSKVGIRILTSQNLIGQGELKLVIQQNNSVFAVQKIQSVKQVNILSLPKKDLPSGILHLTLFNATNLPVAERLIFINNPADQISASVTGLKNSYSPRGNVELTLAAKDGDKPTIGSFSVAVTNTSLVTPDPDNESNILTGLLLTADLKGYVEKPNYYLRNNTKETREHLDNLMLIQGWSRLLWSDLMSDAAKPIAFPPERALKVAGTITTTGGKPVPNGKVSLFSTGGGLFMVDTLTDAKGHFSFDNLSFGDSTKFIVQARNAKNKKYVEINLDILPGQVVTKNKNSGDVEVNVNESIQGYIQKSNSYFDGLNKRGLLERTLLLDQVNVVQKKNPAKNSANLNGAGNADYIMTSKDLGTCITLSQCLQGRVAGMTIQNGKAFLTRNNGQPMQIIFDGMYVEPDFLDNIQPFDVETIEVLKNAGNTAIYGSRGGGGVLIITTKRGGGDLSFSRYSPGIITYAPKGYYAVRQFYSPQYTPEHTDNNEDKRSTVYWNPHVATGDGLGKFNFYNTDEPGTYRIVIEGINEDGHIARKVYTYQVK
ncbi:TonB-dependent outer membrane receptor, SusC/RagA subfamily, signature region [Pedobacter westerhofensis]|uniref:TonB-dependent outer membrane receptor, SusC/RagA subfamily, signature region n=1 Tax=Pedobacter westerhofensis TaxID=425512 RepID=A0A521EIA9_9SPHI|nr:carboxypeptidase-like regulatory domain-containing protein [Pedobacter westerhofensis]SMO83211.1 TonB-dependent outer membrane receptor, SusC/RagA subfamily, signature region [Pedobacter westerhofensis]